MNKKFFFFLFLVGIGLAYFFQIDKYVLQKLTQVGQNISEFAITKTLQAQNWYENYINQTKTIQLLKQKNKELLLQATHLQKQPIDRFDYADQNSTNATEIHRVRVEKYVQLSNFTKVLLQSDDTNTSIHGLITQGQYAAGISVLQENRRYGLLNGNIRCNYAVFIGDEKVPGIVHADRKRNRLRVKFIPQWLELAIGDEVITSGMDGIFFEGLKVGVVTKIEHKPQTKEALVKPYATVLNKRFFYEYINPYSSQ